MEPSDYVTYSIMDVENIGGNYFQLKPGQCNIYEASAKLSDFALPTLLCVFVLLITGDKVMG